VVAAAAAGFAGQHRQAGGGGVVVSCGELLLVDPLDRQIQVAAVA
jgi:hypothetical protein